MRAAKSLCRRPKGCSQNDGAVSGYRYRRGLLGLRVEGLRVADPEGWLRRAGKALLQTVPIAQVPASSLQALGSPTPPGAELCSGASKFTDHPSCCLISLNLTCYIGYSKTNQQVEVFTWLCTRLTL